MEETGHCADVGEFADVLQRLRRAELQRRRRIVGSGGGGVGVGFAPRCHRHCHFKLNDYYFTTLSNSQGYLHLYSFHFSKLSSSSTSYG